MLYCTPETLAVFKSQKVNGRMEVKITNFGIQRLRGKARLERHDTNYLERLMLWQAPEIIKNPNLTDNFTLQKADVYSFD